MAITFNPLTGKFDITGTGGGGGPVDTLYSSDGSITEPRTLTGTTHDLDFLFTTGEFLALFNDTDVGEISLSKAGGAELSYNGNSVKIDGTCVDLVTSAGDITANSGGDLIWTATDEINLVIGTAVWDYLLTGVLSGPEQANCLVLGHTVAQQIGSGPQIHIRSTRGGIRIGDKDTANLAMWTHDGLMQFGTQDSGDPTKNDLMLYAGGDLIGRIYRNGFLQLNTSTSYEPDSIIDVRGDVKIRGGDANAQNKKSNSNSLLIRAARFDVAQFDFITDIKTVVTEELLGGDGYTLFNVDNVSAFKIEKSGNIEIPVIGKGLILTAPGGVRYLTTVNDLGALVTVALP